MRTALAERLADDRPYLGTLVTLGSPEVAEALVLAGFDWLFIDLEHSPALDPAAALRIVQTVAHRVDVLVRVPANEDVWIKKVLDTGADGVIVPHVNTAAEAQRAVRAAKYPPLGRRSVGITPAHGYGANFDGYVADANASTTLVVQIEDIEAVRNLDEILAVEGVDAAFIGPYDLSGSMDKLGQVDDPEVRQAIEQVTQKCRVAGMPLGIFSGALPAALRELERGMRFVAVGTDIGLLMGAAQNAVTTVAKR